MGNTLVIHHARRDGTLACGLRAGVTSTALSRVNCGACLGSARRLPVPSPSNTEGER